MPVRSGSKQNGKWPQLQLPSTMYDIPASSANLAVRERHSWLIESRITFKWGKAQANIRIPPTRHSRRGLSSTQVIAASTNNGTDNYAQ